MNTLKTISMTDLMKGYIPLSCPKNAPPLTLSQIIYIEPRIVGVLAVLKPSRRNQKWFNQYYEAESKLSKLVGWQAGQYILRTCQAYDVVMDTVIEKLDG